MKNIASLVLALSLLFLSACSSPKASQKNTLVGTKVSAYLIGAYEEEKSAIQKLKNAGFEVLASYKSVKKGKTILFTNAALKKEGALPKRAHASILRLFIDEKERSISFTNPIYFGKAFMQKEYKHEVFQRVLAQITNAFENLQMSKDALAYEELENYHFMMGMPYYQESDLLGKKGANNEEILAKAKDYKNGKAIIFTLKLSSSSTLIGYDLGKRTKKFVKKIGRQNAAILPWCISIENGQASALNAKYYIALSYPLLDMGGFMTIATVPGAIIKELEKAFKK